MSAYNAQSALSQNYAAPRCTVQVFPYEGGSYAFEDSAGLFSVSVSQGTQGGGSFEIKMAPGGPEGTNVRPFWTELLTPRSVVVIGMKRATYSKIVMVGLVRSVSEIAERTTAGVVRVTNVSGQDFSAYFMCANTYNLAFLTGVKGLEVSQGISSDISFANAFLSLEDAGLTLYEKVMCDPNLFGSVKINVGDNRVKFTDIMAFGFENYGSNVQIPFSINFLLDETWMAKFRQIFQSPWYEVFIVTADPHLYFGTDFYGLFVRSPVYKFGIDSDNYANASPTLVCRKNPFPTLTANDQSDNPQFSLDMDAWNALPTFSLNAGWRADSIGTSDSEVRNYYQVLPSYIGLLGNGNGNNHSFNAQFPSWYDRASIARYGYNPEIVPTSWWSDPNGIYSQAAAASGKTTDDISKLARDLSLKVVGYHEPVSFMFSGTIKMELRPDILPGVKFMYSPFKDGEMYLFYVDAVSHVYEFSGDSYTTLNISRGLPLAVYEDVETLTALHSGNGSIVDGDYSSDPAYPGDQGIRPVSLNVIAQTDKMFNSPSNPPAS